MRRKSRHLALLAGVFLASGCSGQIGQGPGNGGSPVAGGSGTFQRATIRGNLQSMPHHPPSHSDPSGETQTRDWRNQISQFYSAATATVLQDSATQPDIDGNMLIDNTVIVYVTAVARAWDHNQQNMPLITFAGNDMWLALMPIFGVNMARLGATNLSTGPLAGITNLT